MAEDGAVDAGVKLAEQLQAPVCTSYLHNDSFPKSHPLNMGPLGYQVPIIKLISAFFAYFYVHILNLQELTKIMQLLEIEQFHK